MVCKFRLKWVSLHALKLNQITALPLCDFFLLQWKNAIPCTHYGKHIHISHQSFFNYDVLMKRTNISWKQRSHTQLSVYPWHTLLIKETLADLSLSSTTISLKLHPNWRVPIHFGKVSALIGPEYFVSQINI